MDILFHKISDPLGVYLQKEKKEKLKRKYAEKNPEKKGEINVNNLKLQGIFIIHLNFNKAQRNDSRVPHTLKNVF